MMALLFTAPMIIFIVAVIYFIAQSSIVHTTIADPGKFIPDGYYETFSKLFIPSFFGNETAVDDPDDEEFNGLIANDPLNHVPHSLNQLASFSNVAGCKILTNMHPGRLISPISLAYALSLFHIGSKGATEKEISNFLHGKFSVPDLHLVNEMLSKSGSTRMHNYVLLNKRFQFYPEYLHLLKNLSSLAHEDFTNGTQVRAAANAHINSATSNWFKDSVRAVSTSTSIVMINSVYFHAIWRNGFDKRATKFENFTNSISGTFHNLPMMRGTFRVPYYEDRNIQRVEIPFGGNDTHFVMGIILKKQSPREKKNATLAMQFFTNIVDQLDFAGKFSTSDDVLVTLPRFTQRKKTRMPSLFRKHGIRSLFETNRANLSSLAGGRAFVSEFMHETVVKLEEKGQDQLPRGKAGKGSDAAAVAVKHGRSTAAVPAPASSVPQDKAVASKEKTAAAPKEKAVAAPKDNGKSKAKKPAVKQFAATRSFIYYIRHTNSNTTLFVGDYHGMAK